MPAHAVAAADRRFGGLARLFGDAGLARLHAAHVIVVGIGGVGSWTAEALARSGVGHLTLIDLDHVSESNVNRQIHALDSTLGAPKVKVMAERIGDFAVDCQVDVVEEFVTPENVAALIGPADAVVDAIDQPRAKAALIALCRRSGHRLVVCGGAGGRTDPLRLKRDDLARTRGDALLSGVRARLRREYGFARDAGKKFGITAIYSDEPLPAGSPRGADNSGAPLNCAGYGSVVTVTAAMGLAAAQCAIDWIVRPPKGATGH